MRKKIPKSTLLFRNYPQIKLVGNIIKNETLSKERLRVKIFAVSTGQEAFTLASYLHHLGCLNKVLIYASDIDATSLEEAKSFTIKCRDYWRIPKEIRSEAFLIDPKDNGHYLLKKEVASRIIFFKEDVLTPLRVQYDFVICQNLIVHLRAKHMRLALEKLFFVTKHGGYLIVGGGIPEKIYFKLKKKGMKVITKEIENIHDAWSIQRSAWTKEPRPYWALEPIEHESIERYSTIFKKE